jgi:hypothetical protein
LAMLVKVLIVPSSLQRASSSCCLACSMLLVLGAGLDNNKANRLVMWFFGHDEQILAAHLVVLLF